MNNKKTTEKVCLLVENHMGLANKLASSKNKATPSYVSFDELQSAAYLGLVEAANRFDPTRGFCFTTYAYPRINGAMNDYLRELGEKAVSIDSSDEEGLGLKDSISSKEKCRDDIFDTVEDQLGNQAASMLRSYFVDNFSMKEIGTQMGISEGRVSQIMSGYKNCIRKKWSATTLAA